MRGPRRRVAGECSSVSERETLSSHIVDIAHLVSSVTHRITNATALYSSLLGIRSAYALGSPPTEMIIEYERTEGDSRTLSIKFGLDGKMKDAEVSSATYSRAYGARLSAGSCADPSLSLPPSPLRSFRWAIPQ